MNKCSMENIEIVHGGYATDVQIPEHVKAMIHKSEKSGPISKEELTYEDILYNEFDYNKAVKGIADTILELHDKGYRESDVYLALHSLIEAGFNDANIIIGLSDKEDWRK